MSLISYLLKQKNAMTNLLSFLEFAIDLICLMPPFGDINHQIVTREQAIQIGLGALFLALVALVELSLKDFLNNRAAALVVAVCFTAIAFNAPQSEMYRGIFQLFYPPTIFLIRFGEGAVIGERLAKYLRWWHWILAMTVITGLYYLLTLLPKEALIIFKIAWAIFGIFLASYLWIQKLSGNSWFDGPLVMIALFAILASTLFYISTSTVDQLIYQWALPVGALLVFLIKRVTLSNTRLFS